jgi:hypothetical protein
VVDETVVTPPTVVDGVVQPAPPEHAVDCPAVTRSNCPSLNGCDANAAPVKKSGKIPMPSRNLFMLTLPGDAPTTAKIRLRSQNHPLIGRFEIAGSAGSIEEPVALALFRRSASQPSEQRVISDLTRRVPPYEHDGWMGQWQLRAHLNLNSQ